MADRNLVLQLLITAKDQASAALRGIGASVKTMGDAVSQVLAPLRTFGGLLATAAGIGGAKELADRADAYIRVSNSLKVATRSEAEYQAALKDVAAIAARTNADIETTAQLYGKVAQSAKELGLSQTQVGQLTEVISKGMQLTGASAATASGAILQLTQAFGSGALRGEEFNSVMEASPELLRFLAAGLGVTIGELRGLAEQGALTSRAVSAALLSQKDAIDKAYGETTRTVGQSFTALNNQLILYVGQLNESTAATATIGSALKLLADNLNVVAAAAGAGLAAALGKSTQALISYAKESIAARAAARDHAIAAEAQRTAALAAAQGNVAAAQAAVNRAIAEQRAAQAALQAAAGDEAVTRARAAAAAAATTATAATNRYITAQAALNAAQATTATGAGLLSRAMGFLAGPGGLILLAVSAFGALLPLLSSNKTEIDALKKSTDEYKDSLKAMTAAQLAAELLKIEDALKEQKSVVSDAKREWEIYKVWLDNASESGRNVEKTQRDLTEAEANLDTQTKKLNELLNIRNILLGEQTNKQKSVLDNSAKELVQYQQIVLAMQTYAKDLEALGKQQKAITSANEERIQAELELAKATGDVQAVDRLTLELATARAAAARQQAELDRAAAVAAGLKLDAVQKEYNLIKEKQPKDEEALRLARQDAELKNAQAAASTATARALQEQANQTSRLNTAQLSQLSAQERILVAARSEAEASAQLAIEKGYEYQARQDIVRVAEIEARLAQLNADRKAIEAQAAIASLNAVQAEIEAKLALNEVISDETRARLEAATAAMNAAALEAQAAGLVAEAEAKKAAAIQMGNLNTDQAKDKTKAHTEAVKDHSTFVAQDGTAVNLQSTAVEKSTEKHGSLAQVVGSLIDYWRQHTAALSETTRALFEYNAGLSKVDPRLSQNAFDGLSEEAGKAAAKIGELTAFIRQMDQQMLFSTGSVGNYMDMIQKSGAVAERAYYEQKLEAEKLTAQLNEIGETGGRSFANVSAALNFVTRNAATAKDAFWLLNDQDMDQLQNELDRTTDRLREMQQETEDARRRLQELNAELLEAKGLDEKSELLRQQLDYEERREEIVRRIAEAEAMGNRDLVATLNDQLSVLAEINRQKLRNIETDREVSRDSTGEADRVRDAWAGAADEVERAASGLSRVGNTDLSNLYQQVNRVGEAAGGLARLL